MNIPDGYGGVMQGSWSQVRNDEETARSCDDLCMCKQTDSSSLLSYSHACRAKLKVGSNCRLPLQARAGTNYASGVHDEFFAFTATAQASGACKVYTSQRDALLAVYGACARVGPQEPLAFSTSAEGHLASAEWKCTPGRTYYFFWNAEYMPGRHSFIVQDRIMPGRPVGVAPVNLFKAHVDRGYEDDDD